MCTPWWYSFNPIKGREHCTLKSVIVILGIWTQGRRMVGTGKTTILWRPPYSFPCPKQFHFVESSRFLFKRKTEHVDRHRIPNAGHHNNLSVSFSLSLYRTHTPAQTHFQWLSQPHWFSLSFSLSRSHFIMKLYLNISSVNFYSYLGIAI